MLYYDQFIEKEQTHEECCAILYAGGQNLISYALWHATYKRLAAEHNITSFSNFRQHDTVVFG